MAFTFWMHALSDCGDGVGQRDDDGIEDAPQVCLTVAATCLTAASRYRSIQPNR